MVTRPTPKDPGTLGDRVRAKLEHGVIQAMASDDPAAGLCRVVADLGHSLHADRCSLLTPLGRDRLRIFASTDPESIGDTVIALDRYPELDQVVASGTSVLIRDAHSSQLLRSVRNLVKSSAIISIVAVPLRLQEVLTVLRMTSNSRAFSPNDLDRLQDAARVVERTVLEHDVQPRTEEGWRRLAVEASEASFEVLPDGRIGATHGGRNRAMVEAVKNASDTPLLNVLHDPEDSTDEWLSEMLAGGTRADASPRTILVDGHRVPVRVTSALDTHLPPRLLVSLISVAAPPSGQPDDNLAETRALGGGGSEEARLRSTIDRLEGQLTEMQHQVEHLAARRTLFFSSSAHELKTPLTVLQVYLETLLNELATGMTEEQVSFVEICHESVLRLRRLVLDMVDLAAFETGRVRLQIERVDIEPTLVTVIEEMRPLAERAEIELGLETGSRASARADEGRLQQIVRNLIDNSLKNTPAGGSVRVRIDRESDSVHISVSDTGVGIPADRIAEVFDEFVRLQPNQHRDGSGLGLAVCRKLVDAMGGKISVRSDRDRGAVFTVRLPAWPDDA